MSQPDEIAINVPVVPRVIRPIRHKSIKVVEDSNLLSAERVIVGKVESNTIDCLNAHGRSRSW